MGYLLLFLCFHCPLIWDLTNSPQVRCESSLEQSEIAEAAFLLYFISGLSQPYLSAFLLPTPRIANPVKRHGRCPNIRQKSWNGLDASDPLARWRCLKDMVAAGHVAVWAVQPVPLCTCTPERLHTRVPAHLHSCVPAHCTPAHLHTGPRLPPRRNNT